MVATGSSETALCEVCAVFSDVRPNTDESSENPTGDINAWFAVKIKMSDLLSVCYWLLTIAMDQYLTSNGCQWLYAWHESICECSHLLTIILARSTEIPWPSMVIDTELVWYPLMSIGIFVLCNVLGASDCVLHWVSWLTVTSPRLHGSGTDWDSVNYTLKPEKYFLV